MSTTSAPSWEWRFPNRSPALAQVSSEAVQRLETAGANARQLYLATLTLEELGTNLLKYGFDDPHPHEVLLQVHFHQGTVRLVLEDDGHPFDPWAQPEPDVSRPASERPIGGLGLHLVRRLASHVAYERRHQRNRVTVLLKPEPEPSPT